MLINKKIEKVETDMIYGFRVTNTFWMGAGIVLVLTLIAGGLMLKKAGESPWKILIPIYGGYCLYKISNSEGIFWGTLIVSVVSGIISSVVSSGITNNIGYYGRVSSSDLLPLRIIAAITALIILIMQFSYSRQLADAFGKGTGFAIGLFFLFPIFAMILGFGSAVYGGRGGLEKIASSVGTWKCGSCGCENPVSRGSCQNCGAQK